MKFLVIDDSLFVRKYIGNMLKKEFAEAEISYAGSGLEGFDQYKNTCPDYIITDLLMPIMDGKEMIKQIRNTDKNVKIIVYSADVQKAVRQEMMDLGVMLFINKPLDDEKQELLLKALKGE